jgi:hypothetical protein
MVEPDTGSTGPGGPVSPVDLPLVCVSAVGIGTGADLGVECVVRIVEIDVEPEVAHVSGGDEVSAAARDVESAAIARPAICPPGTQMLYSQNAPSTSSQWMSTA